MNDNTSQNLLHWRRCLLCDGVKGSPVVHEQDPTIRRQTEVVNGSRLNYDPKARRCQVERCAKQTIEPQREAHLFGRRPGLRPGNISATLPGDFKCCDIPRLQLLRGIAPGRCVNVPQIPTAFRTGSIGTRRQATRDPVPTIRSQKGATRAPGMAWDWLSEITTTMAIKICLSIV